MNYKKTGLALVGLLALLAGNLLGNIHIAAAAPTGPSEDDIRSAQISWVDRDHLQAVIGQQTYTFTDGNPGDTTYDYSIQSYGCDGKIHVPDMTNAGQVQFDMDAIPTSGASTKCANVSGANGDTFTANNAGNAAMMFYRKDQNTITRSDANGNWTFTKSSFVNSSGQTVFLRSSENGQSCQDRMLVSADGQTAQLLVLDPKSKPSGIGIGGNNKAGYMGKLTADQRTTVGLASENSTCYVFGAASGSGIDSWVTMPLGSPGNATGPATPVPGSTGSGSDSSDADNTVDCGGEGFNWLICPVIKMGIAAGDKLDTFIMSTLNVDVGPIFDQTTTSGSASQGYYTAWSSFRVIATAIIIIAGIIMVVSQALGFEMLDAYTVRKTLPRLLVAVIGISLSWPLMRLAVSFFDVLGFDLRNLMYAPFKTFGTTISSTTGILSTIGVIGALFIIGPASLTFIITALLAVFVGFMILVIRQVALIMLIILAPVAIACYVLPNTQKVWKLWSENFMGLLLMFPIISALIAAGHIFAAVSLKSHTGNTPADVIPQAIGIVAYFVPYFLLPLAARLATGVIGNLAGVVNDRGKGAFDRLKKYRGGKAARNLANMRSGTRTNNRAINALTARATTSSFGYGRRGRAAYTDKMNLAAAEHAKSAQGMASQHNDDVLKALTYGSAVEARSRMAKDWGMTDPKDVEQAIAGARATGGFGKARQIYALKAAAATGTTFETDTQMYSAIARVSGGNEGTAAMLYGDIRASSERAGRNDLKAGHGAGTKLISDIMKNGDTNLSADEMESKYGARLAALGVDAARGVDGMSLARNKPKSVQNIMKRLDQSRAYHQTRLADPNLSDEQRSYSETALGQIRAKMENMETNINYGPEVNAEAVYGARQSAPDQSEAHSGDRNAGIVNSHPAAKSAQENAAGSYTAYGEERITRQTMDPRLDPRQGPDEQ